MTCIIYLSSRTTSSAVARAPRWAGGRAGLFFVGLGCAGGGGSRRRGGGQAGRKRTATRARGLGSQVPDCLGPSRDRRGTSEETILSGFYLCYPSRRQM